MTRRKAPRVQPFAFDLTVLTAEDVASANGLPAVTRSLQFDAGPAGRINLCFDACQAMPMIAEEIDLTLADQPLTLRLDRPFLAPLVKRAGHAVEGAVMTDDPMLAGLVLEHLLTPSLCQLESDHKTAIRIDRVGAPKPLPAKPPPAKPMPAQALPLRVRCRLTADLWDEACAAEILAPTPSSAELLRSLLASGDTAQRTPPPTDLPLIARVRSTAFQVRAGDLAALQPGDGLFPDPEWRLDGPLVLAFSDRHLALADWEGDSLIVTGLSDAPALPIEEIAAMPPYDDDSITIDDVTVTLSLELDRIEISFAALGDLRTGSIVPFKTTRPQAVRVLANGRAFATADLVQVDDRLGVRITGLVPRAE
jgi:type III secretion system YscQ/HrcQ family protein